MRTTTAAACALLTLTALPAWAGPQCTTADRKQWQNPRQFEQKLKAEGYDIRRFQVTEGNCYEIYGWNKDRQKVEIYFDPVTGRAVKTEIG